MNNREYAVLRVVPEFQPPSTWDDLASLWTNIIHYIWTPNGLRELATHLAYQQYIRELKGRSLSAPILESWEKQGGDAFTIINLFPYDRATGQLNMMMMKDGLTITQLCVFGQNGHIEPGLEMAAVSQFLGGVGKPERWVSFTNPPPLRSIRDVFHSHPLVCHRI